MKYSREGEEVTIKFSIEEYEDLMSIAGYALIAAKNNQHVVPLSHISNFISSLNETNHELGFYYNRIKEKELAKQDTTGSSGIS